MAGVAPGDERRHPAGGERDWEEWWTFEVAAPDASFGLLVRLGLWPNLGRAWYWAYLVGDGRPLLAVRHHEVPLPRGSVLEVRADSLWSAMHCETPLEHWSVGLEAFAVALDDAGDAFRGERGDLVALGLDLEWEADGPLLVPAGAGGGSPLPTGGAVTDTSAPAPGGRYDQPCLVHGEVLIGRESIDLHAPGHRARGWGAGNGWRSPWSRAAGRLAGGTTFAATGADGVVAAPAAEPAGGSFWVAAERDADGFPGAGELRVGGLQAGVEPRHHVAVPLDGPASGGRLVASLCRLTAAGAGHGDAGPGHGEAGTGHGVGWVAWHDRLPGA